MLNKLRDWLFKEDYEELDLGEDTNEDADEDEHLQSVYKDEKPYYSEPARVQRVENIVKEEIPEVKTKISLDIKVDEPTIVEKKVEVEKEMTTIKTRPSLTRKEEFEMTPVISPFFGVKGEDNIVNETPHLTTTSTVHKKDTFNSVISPFYGVKETKKEICETTYHGTYATQNNETSSFITLDEASNEFDEDDNLSLDDIVSSKVEDENDTIQFSLFGEAKKIHDDEFRNEDTETDNDELPF